MVHASKARKGCYDVMGFISLKRGTRKHPIIKHTSGSCCNVPLGAIKLTTNNAIYDNNVATYMVSRENEIGSSWFVNTE